MSDPISSLSVGDLVAEFDKALPILISAAEVVQKFSLFLPANVKTTVDEAVSILTAIQSIVSKL